LIVKIDDTPKHIRGQAVHKPYVADNDILEP